MTERPLSRPATTRVLCREHRYWIAGLGWEEKQKKRLLPRPVRGTRALQVTLTLGGRHGQTPSRLCAKGETGPRYRHQKLYSLAALLCQRTPDGYGVWQLDDGDQVFLAAVNGLPSLMADVVGDPAHISQAVALFLSFNPAPAKGWQVLSEPAAPQSWETLVREVSARELRFARVSRVSNPLPVCVAGTLGALLLGGVYWWNASPAALPGRHRRRSRPGPGSCSGLSRSRCTCRIPGRPAPG